MRIFKDSIAGEHCSLSADDLEAINTLSKTPLSADEVFTFDILLCDNEIDRDYERFTVDALEALKELFLGTSGIFDHNWSAYGQKARIFKTQVLSDESKRTQDGEVYTYLKASAYMLLNDENSALISEIKGGIKKEVSVGCSVAKITCNICGEPDGSSVCSHIKGAEYNNRVCCRVLDEPTDAYEWSFVAVPAQRDAGVIKRFSSENGSDAVKHLEKEAALGRAYLKALRSDTLKVGIMAVPELDEDTLKSALSKLDENEIMYFKGLFEKRLDKMFPPACQLIYQRAPEKIENESYYKI